MNSEIIRKECCTMNLRRILDLAEAKAKELNSKHIHVSHILFAIVAFESCHAVRLLKELGCDTEALQKKLGEVLSRMQESEGSSNASDTSEAKCTFRTCHVIGLATDEAVRERKGFVYSHHMLLGILAGGQGAAFDLLTESGISGALVRDKYAEFTAEPVENDLVPG
jgi:ATP-dependent Clp protease ATP-binding subunit ClpC